MNAPENGSFAAGTALWCSLAARMLGWRPGDFWGATPAELIASLREPLPHETSPPPARDLIARMLERDSNE